jgi:hypothetical protein
MSRFFSFFVFLLFLSNCNGQAIYSSRGEFANNSNGLMYSDTSMAQLREMVNSLNLRFKSCEFNKTFYSYEQGKLWSVEFGSATNDLKVILKDLNKNLHFDTLIVKYKRFIKSTDTTQTIVRIKNNAPEEDEEKNYYLCGNPLEGYDNNYVLSSPKKEIIPGKWIYEYDKKDQYNKAYSISCYFIPEPLIQKRIPKEYATYIQYVDCMIDTTASVFLSSGYSSRYGLKKLATVDALNQFLNQKLNISKKGNTDDFEYISSEKYNYAIENLKNDSEFARLVQEAAEECIENNTGGEMLEQLVAVFVSKAMALNMKRHRRVIGQCSQDQSPRWHARNIAILAAESNSWDIFLRAHMDIMNDRFERMTDGSYAYEGRKTYLKELEELNLNVVDLMLGLSLRSANVSDNHYNGTVWRLGWALCESKDKHIFEEKIIQMLKDKQLDEFNRGLLFVLLHSYLYRMEDIKLANQKIDFLKKEADQFPYTVKAAIYQLKQRSKKDKN